jgi:predicted secreted protein
MSRKFLPPAVAAMVAACLIPVSDARAADAPPKDIPGKTEIHLSQQAVRVMARDRLRAELRIEAKGNNGREIQAEINKRMAAALAKVKAYGAVVAETGSYSVDRNYNTKEAALWQGSQSLSLSSEDFDAVLSLVGDLQSSGLLMSEMRFFLAPETLTAVQDELTATALTALRARADSVAKDLGMAIDHYRLIGINNAREDSERSLGRSSEAGAARSGKAPPPSVQAGDATVLLSVSADVVLAPIKSY